MLKHLDSVCARAMAAMTSTLPEKLEAEQAKEVEQASDAESTDSWFSITTPPSCSRSPSRSDSPLLAEEAVMTKEELESIYAELEEKWGHPVGLYVHGSTIFANHVPNDLDLIAIVEEPKQELAQDSPDSQFVLGRCEVSVYAKECFLEKMESMDLTMLTCLHTPPRFVLKRLEDPRIKNLEIDADLLEASVISYAIFTWKKVQRVLDEWQDAYKASKNAYFVFRVMNLGCQLAEHGCIRDLKAANAKWDVVRGIFEDLDIKPGDSNVVEAVLAHDFLRTLRHFQRQIALAKASGAPPLNEEEPISDTCAVCLEPKESSSSWIRLVNCRHCFHASCIAQSLRARPQHPACPMCRASVRMDESSDPTVTKWFQEKVRSSKRSRYSYAGYPATLRVREQEGASNR